MIFKKNIAFLFLLGSLQCSISAERDSLDSNPSKGNWTEQFQTALGPIIHTPEKVQLGFMSMKGKFVNKAGSSFNGYTFLKDLVLEVNVTREEFIQELIKGGVYP